MNFIDSIYAHLSEDFKAEALKRKTAVKKEQSSPKEFEDWILVQSSILYKI